MDDVHFCRNCGKMIQPGEKYCSNCGTPVENGSSGAYPSYGNDKYNAETPTPAQYRPTYSSSSYNSNSGTDIAGFVFGLLSVLFGGFLFVILGFAFSSKNKDTNKFAKAGFVLSIIGIFVSILYTVVTISVLVQH